MGSGCSSQKSLQLVETSLQPHQHQSDDLVTSTPLRTNQVGSNVTKTETKESIHHQIIGTHADIFKTRSDENSNPDKFFNQTFFTTTSLVQNTLPIFTNRYPMTNTDLNSNESVFDRHRKNGTHRRVHPLKKMDSFDSDLMEESEEEGSTSEDDSGRFYLEMTKKSITNNINNNSTNRQQQDNRLPHKTNKIGYKHNSNNNSNNDISISQQNLFSQSRRTSLVPSIYSIPENTWLDELESAFYRYARFGDMSSKVDEMNRTCWAKLCKDCGFVDRINIVPGDVDVIFIKHKPKTQRHIDFETFMKCLDEIADRKFAPLSSDPMERREIIYKNVIGRDPDLTNATEAAKTRNVRRMTDHNLFPAVHRIRFDESERKLLRRDSSLSNLHRARRTSLLPSDTDSMISNVTRSFSPINIS